MQSYNPTGLQRKNKVLYLVFLGSRVEDRIDKSDNALRFLFSAAR
jgi:hypothetical protein